MDALGGTCRLDPPLDGRARSDLPRPSTTDGTRQLPPSAPVLHGEIRAYIDKRRRGMNYQELLQRDLELGTGPVEGAIKNLMGRRMDHGGMHGPPR